MCCHLGECIRRGLDGSFVTVVEDWVLVTGAEGDPGAPPEDWKPAPRSVVVVCAAAQGQEGSSEAESTG